MTRERTPAGARAAHTRDAWAPTPREAAYLRALFRPVRVALARGVPPGWLAVALADAFPDLAARVAAVAEHRAAPGAVRDGRPGGRPGPPTPGDWRAMLRESRRLRVARPRREPPP